MSIRDRRHCSRCAVLALPAAAEDLPLDADAAVALVVEASDRGDAADARSRRRRRAGVGAADAARLPTLDLTASVAQRSSVPELSVPLDGARTLAGCVLFPNIQNVYRAGVPV